MTTNLVPAAEPEIVRLVTLQFAWGGLLDARPADGWAVHLVRGAKCGTPGLTLCGIDRFADSTPGWSLGGGLSGPGIVHRPCDGCVSAAVKEFPGLPVSGSIGAKEIRAALEAAQVGAVTG